MGLLCQLFSETFLPKQLSREPIQHYPRALGLTHTLLVPLVLSQLSCRRSLFSAAKLGTDGSQHKHLSDADELPMISSRQQCCREPRGSPRPRRAAYLLWNPLSPHPHITPTSAHHQYLVPCLHFFISIGHILVANIIPPPMNLSTEHVWR